MNPDPLYVPETGLDNLRDAEDNPDHTAYREDHPDMTDTATFLVGVWATVLAVAAVAGVVILCAIAILRGVR